MIYSLIDNVHIYGLLLSIGEIESLSPYLLKGSKMKTTISLALVIILGLVLQVAKADFIVDTPRNIGPAVNNSGIAIAPGISADSLELYFMSWQRPDGFGGCDIYVTTRETTDDDWGEPRNLGPIVNSPNGEFDPSISGDGLSLYFSDGLWDVQVPRPGGFGGGDIWVTRRDTLSDPWGVSENLGSIINSSSTEGGPSISADSLSLFFESDRPGGPGTWNIWATTRPSVSSPWGTPVNLGPEVNSSAFDAHPEISSDGLTLFFQSRRSGPWDIWMTTRPDVSHAFGSPVNIGQMISETVKGFPSISTDGRMLYFTPDKFEVWQAPFITIIDFNGDGVINAMDMSIMVDCWGTDEPLCDIGPMPWGDGVIDVQDLVVLAKHLFEDVNDPTLVTHWALDEAEGMVAYDSVGTNDGYVLGDAIWQPDGGKVDGALWFDGVDDFISAPAVLKPADGPFSILVWIKGGAGGQAIISETGGPDWLSLDPLTGCLMTDLKASGRGASPLLSQTIISDDNWHRISFVWDSLYRTLHVDGVIVAEDTQDDLQSPGGGLYIGCGDPIQPSTFFSGMIDDVRIYNRAVIP